MEENSVKVDDGARFILECKGTCIRNRSVFVMWIHLTTSIMAPPLLILRTLSSSEDGLHVYRVWWEK
ncbi:unnamed protein product [Brassica oleracea var. botrytis]